MMICLNRLWFHFIPHANIDRTNQVWKASRGAGPEMVWATKLGGKNIKSTGEC